MGTGGPGRDAFRGFKHSFARWFLKLLALSGAQVRLKAAPNPSDKAELMMPHWDVALLWCEHP